MYQASELSVTKKISVIFDPGGYEVRVSRNAQTNNADVDDWKLKSCEDIGFEPLTRAVLPLLKPPPEPPPRSLPFPCSKCMEFHSIQFHYSTPLCKMIQLMKEPELDLEDKVDFKGGVLIQPRPPQPPPTSFSDMR